MRATILMDNLAARGLEAEWGLSIYVEYQGHAILLDTGASDRFARNADALGIDLSTVSFGVLSHAHWDHGNGMGTFFARNPTAPFYLRQGCGETCYDKTPEGWRYEGLQRGLAANMYRKVGDQWLPDDFSHEQSLVFSTPKGLVIFNSCCHGGADNIVREVADTFPGQPISAIVGGFHLYDTPAQEVRAFAHRLGETGVTQVITGHCTGPEALDILTQVLGSRVQPLSTGLVLTF